MRKKFLMCFMATMITLTGCGGTDAAQSSAEEVSDHENRTDQTDNAVESQEESETIPEVSIEEQIVFDQDGIRITATGIDIEGSFMGSELRFLIENESDKSITVQTRSVAVNGYMTDALMSADVAPQKKNNDTLTFSASSLEECGIGTIAEIEFSFHIFDSETWDDLIDSDLICLRTSCADSYTQAYDDSGDLIYEDDSVKIISKGMVSDGIFGPEVKLYIENKLEQNITIQTRDTSIDGFMLDASFSPEIAAKKRAISSITFMSSDLEENGLTNFSSVETSFHIFYTDSWDTITDTEPVTIQL